MSPGDKPHLRISFLFLIGALIAKLCLCSAPKWLPFQKAASTRFA